MVSEADRLKSLIEEAIRRLAKSGSGPKRKRAYYRGVKRNNYILHSQVIMEEGIVICANSLAKELFK